MVQSLILTTMSLCAYLDLVNAAGRGGGGGSVGGGRGGESKGGGGSSSGANYGSSSGPTPGSSAGTRSRSGSGLVVIGDPDLDSAPGDGSTPSTARNAAPAPHAHCRQAQIISRESYRRHGQQIEAFLDPVTSVATVTRLPIVSLQSPLQKLLPHIPIHA